jgi:hypothetical protein
LEECCRTDLVTLTVDAVEIRVPKGLMVVDAAKRAKVADIPVFCYHPKLTAVGMCRMCLVEIGTPKLDQQTRQPVLDEQGRPVIAWMPKLQTARTTPVSEGMAVRTATAQVKSAQKEIPEFLLTSHPLDCSDLPEGRRVPAAEPDPAPRPRRLALPLRREAAPRQAQAARRPDFPGRGALHSVLALHPLPG